MPSEKSTKRKKKFPTKCKCPTCEEDHIVILSYKPTIKPRIFCKRCDHRRNQDDEGLVYKTG